MDYKVFTAKTKEEAITAACMELGVTSDRLDFVVDDEGSSGFFGLGSKEAVIRAKVRDDNEPLPTPPAASEGDGPRIKTLDEIEAKAAAVAAKGGDDDNIGNREERPKRNDRRGKGRRKERAGDKAPFREEVEAREDYVPSTPKPPREVVERTPEEIEAIKKCADEFLGSVFEKMGLTVEKTLEYDEANGALNIEFAGDEMGILIGKRGQTLDSIQYLTSLVVNKDIKDYVRVKLDTEEYRRRRKETLEGLARSIAGKVRRTHHAVVLEPMNPYERRIIHSALQGNRAVDTYSEGDEPYRRVVVTPKKHG